MEDAASHLLTTEQVADLLQVHPKHVYRLLKRGLPGRKLGGEWRFLRDEVLAWAMGREDDRSAEARPPILAANGDLAVEALLQELRRRDGPVLGMLRADRESGLGHVRAGRALLAGYHGPETDDPDPSRAHGGMSRIHLVVREIGLAARTSWRLPAVTDLLRVRLASRPGTAGVRALLDLAIRRTGLDPEEVHESALILGSHRDVVLAVVTGRAQAGIATRAWAEHAGLAFAPLGRERYGVLVRTEDLDAPETQALVQAARSSDFRDALVDLGGYDPADAGEITTPA